MTLELDKRFQVIVNLLALHVYDGKQTELSGRELYDDCRQQWPAGPPRRRSAHSWSC